MNRPWAGTGLFVPPLPPGILRFAKDNINRFFKQLAANFIRNRAILSGFPVRDPEARFFRAPFGPRQNFSTTSRPAAQIGARTFRGRPQQSRRAAGVCGLSDRLLAACVQIGPKNF